MPAKVQVTGFQFGCASCARPINCALHCTADQQTALEPIFWFWKDDVVGKTKLRVPGFPMVFLSTVFIIKPIYVDGHTARQSQMKP